MNVCGYCLAEIGEVAQFAWWTVLYEKDGSIHECEEDNES